MEKPIYLVHLHDTNVHPKIYNTRQLLSWYLLEQIQLPHAHLMYSKNIQYGHVPLLLKYPLCTACKSTL